MLQLLPLGAGTEHHLIRLGRMNNRRFERKGAGNGRESNRLLCWQLIVGKKL